MPCVEPPGCRSAAMKFRVPCTSTTSKRCSKVETRTSPAGSFRSGSDHRRGKPAAKLQRRLANVEHDDFRGYSRAGAGHQRKQAGVLGAGDEYVAAPAREEFPAAALPVSIPPARRRWTLSTGAGRSKARADCGIRRTDAPTTLGVGGDPRQVFDVMGPATCRHGTTDSARHRHYPSTAPSAPANCTQPTMRDLALSMSFLEKKSSGFTLSTG